METVVAIFAFFGHHWYVYPLLHIICAALGYGIFHNVDCGIFAMSSICVLMGPFIFICLALEVILIGLFLIFCKAPYNIGIIIRDMLVRKTFFSMREED